MDRNLDHPLRTTLVNELHARPSPRIKAPCHAVYLAFKDPGEAAARDRDLDVAHLTGLAARHGGPKPARGDSHYSATLGRHHVVWESHTEFVSYTALAEGLPPQPFDPASAAIFSTDWQQGAPGKRVTAAMVRIEPLPGHLSEIDTKLADWFSRDGLTAFWVLDRSALVASDFRIDPDGWMRFAVFVRPETGAGRTGRIIQRLCEIETYRAMSMLGLGRARLLSARLNGLEPELAAMVDGMENGPAEATLHRLLSVSSRLETLATQSAFRFGATRAYEAIVMDRVNALREERYGGKQLLSEFMTRRYDPAMRTVTSTQARLSQMLERTGRAGELLRTRVEVDRSAQNQLLLESMDRRAEMQLRLQHTVEGLSVVAISYYAVGLLGYLAAPLAGAAGIDKPVLMALATPLVVGLVWMGLRRLKAAIQKS
ncbi:Uncharacterized membrane-anchored protein [Paracoccus isoporae]|uniref:Uncharacterized membrane-anchored protein n=1 Tax=Paracoccus isoporae TaxID=591205 RepID=A0A1G6XCK8_9RHOB|nr:DUF3422 domain-containing protein [Paracoccus isoporae]SDD75523.1 Uncharacterized membrane-anchored protein [Paracoccus isoporae]